MQDVKYAAQGRLSSVQADNLVPQKVITADSLQIQASNTGLRIWGPGQIGDVGFDVQWSQAIGPEHNGSSEVKGLSLIHI